MGINQFTLYNTVPLYQRRKLASLKVNVPHLRELILLAVLATPYFPSFRCLGEYFLDTLSLESGRCDKFTGLEVDIKKFGFRLTNIG